MGRGREVEGGWEGGRWREEGGRREVEGGREGGRKAKSIFS